VVRPFLDLGHCSLSAPFLNFTFQGPFSPDIPYRSDEVARFPCGSCDSSDSRGLALLSSRGPEIPRDSPQGSLLLFPTKRLEMINSDVVTCFPHPPPHFRGVRPRDCREAGNLSFSRISKQLCLTCSTGRSPKRIILVNPASRHRYPQPPV